MLRLFAFRARTGCAGDVAHNPDFIFVIRFGPGRVVGAEERDELAVECYGYMPRAGVVGDYQSGG